MWSRYVTAVQSNTAAQDVRLRFVESKERSRGGAGVVDWEEEMNSCSFAGAQYFRRLIVRYVLWALDE
jgi:hypothetical protein